MGQGGQTYFKNLAADTVRFLKLIMMSWNKGLKNIFCKIIQRFLRKRQ